MRVVIDPVVEKRLAIVPVVNDPVVENRLVAVRVVSEPVVENKFVIVPVTSDPVVDEITFDKLMFVPLIVIPLPPFKMLEIVTAPLTVAADKRPEVSTAMESKPELLNVTAPLLTVPDKPDPMARVSSPVFVIVAPLTEIPGPATGVNVSDDPVNAKPGDSVRLLSTDFDSSLI